MHGIEFVETLIIIFQPWTVSFDSYIERQPPVSSCGPGIFNAFKIAQFAPVQLTYVSKAYMHDIGFVETTIMVFRHWTVSSYSFIESQPPESSCSRGAFKTLKNGKLLHQFNWPKPAEPSCTILGL